MAKLETGKGKREVSTWVAPEGTEQDLERIADGRAIRQYGVYDIATAPQTYWAYRVSARRWNLGLGTTLRFVTFAYKGDDIVMFAAGEELKLNKAVTNDGFTPFYLFRDDHWKHILVGDPLGLGFPPDEIVFEASTLIPKSALGRLK